MISVLPGKKWWEDRSMCMDSYTLAEGTGKLPSQSDERVALEEETGIHDGAKHIHKETYLVICDHTL